MPGSAHLASLTALKEFRVALCKFAAVVQGALGQADAELQHTLRWLRQDQAAYWKSQVRQREEQLKQTQLLLHNKKYLQADPDSGRSFIDEQRAVAAAQRRLEEARERLLNTQHWLPKLEKDGFAFRGQTQGLLLAVEVEVPNACAALDRMIDALQAYLALAPPDQELAPAAPTAFSAPPLYAPAPLEKPAPPVKTTVPVGPPTPSPRAPAMPEAPAPPSDDLTPSSPPSPTDTTADQDHPSDPAPPKPQDPGLNT